MQQKKFVLTLISFMVILLPFNVEAKTIDNKENRISFIKQEYIHSFAKSSNTKKEETVKSCTGDESLLGDVNDENSVAWLLQKIFNYIKILGPSLTIVFSSIDYIKAIVSSDEKQMNKVNSNFIKRMIAAVLLFFIPTITSAVFDVFGITTDCGIS